MKKNTTISIPMLLLNLISCNAIQVSPTINPQNNITVPPQPPMVQPSAPPSSSLTDTEIKELLKKLTDKNVALSKSEIIALQQELEKRQAEVKKNNDTVPAASPASPSTSSGVLETVSPTASPAANPAPEATPIVTMSQAPSVASTITPEPSTNPSSDAGASAVASPSVSASGSSSAAASASPSIAPSGSPAPTTTPTSTPTNTPAPTPTPTPTPVPTATPTPMLLPIGSKIVVGSINGTGIQIMDHTGSLTTLSAGQGEYISAARISPNKTKIAYLRINSTSGVTDLYVMNMDGSNRIRVYNADPSKVEPNFAWSPQSNYIAFAAPQSSGGTEVLRVSATGGSALRLTNQSGFDGNPTWSPGGDQIFYTGSGNTCGPCTVNTNGGNISPFTTSDNTLPTWFATSNGSAWGSNYSVSDWSNVNNKIAIQIFKGSEVAIYVGNSNGTNFAKVRVLGNTYASTATSLTWTPDGQNILLTIGTTIYLMSQDGSTLTNLSQVYGITGNFADIR